MLRRRCRALIREHGIPVEPGDCLTASTALAAVWPEAFVVQGLVHHPTGTMTHAWLHVGDAWVDPTMGQLNEEVARYCAPAIGVFRADVTAVSGLNGHRFRYVPGSGKALAVVAK